MSVPFAVSVCRFRFSFLFGGGGVRAQTPCVFRPTTVRIAAALVMASLARDGLAQDASARRERYATSRVVLESEAGALGRDEAAAFAELLDRGISEIEALVGPGLPAWARRSGPVRVIVSQRVSMSRTYGHTILLPAERVRTRSAPYLHESVHALVPFRGTRVWLSEGLACYLESWVSEHRGGYDAHVFTRAGNRGIHAVARRWLARDAGQAVLPWVGRGGQPPEMDADRSGVARPFYVLSHSLLKHLVDSVGIDRVVRLLTEGDEPKIFERETGRSESSWKDDWLAAVAAPPSASAR
jgi:hypothetical protein